jgi:hypothetical protein
MIWLVENTEIVPDFDRFEEFEAKIGTYGVTMIETFRTPMQTLNIDLVGTERFCLDYGLEVPDLFELRNALEKQFMNILDVMKKCPGRYVKALENPTMDMLGPDFYRRWLLPMYQEMSQRLPDKRIVVHFDSELACVKDLVAASPFHAIESLTEAPEGDMTYDECRNTWPEKVLLCNINVGLYSLPPAELRRAVSAKAARAGQRGVAFQISEDLPANWKETIPLVLETLRTGC